MIITIRTIPLTTKMSRLLFFFLPLPFATANPLQAASDAITLAGADKFQKRSAPLIQEQWFRPVSGEKGSKRKGSGHRVIGPSDHLSTGLITECAI
jgi:hypothetical protein